MWCRFYFQNAALQTCLALQALTARPNEVFECIVHVHQNRSLVPSASPEVKCPSLGCASYLRSQGTLMFVYNWNRDSLPPLRATLR